MNMSYRGFKRLLGETSLERKCRFLFGAGILLLITGSFWLYAYQTENVAYEQTKTTCRLLVQEIVKDRHNNAEIQRLIKAAKKEEKPADAVAYPIDSFGQYQHHWLHENDPSLEPFERELLRDFAKND